ncbi:MAG: hypothetical protein F4213_09290 [Boseongicola sp. SB0677_bin_26]|nr:hypothetical protein [Boseongicola sp. SB0665_bin_10]MYG26205.1 hypothetical protein [Boseongicola sp. SB0677_bin_26]
METEAVAKESDALDPADVLGDLESLDALDAEIERVRHREEQRLVKLARKAGYFHRRMKNAEILGLFRDPLQEVPKRPSTLARLETRRDLLFAGPRTRNARRKALLGGFVVAQCRLKPDVHAALVPDIREFLWSHRNEDVGARNVRALAGFLADPGDKGLSAPPTISMKARKERTHRLILLGAWVLARREHLKELRDLVSAELVGFLEQVQRVDRHKALLKDLLDQA